MTKIERSALLPFSAQQMYNIVNDVTQYPSFLKNCISASVISEDQHHMVACLELAKAGIHQKFTTRNQLVDGESIRLSLQEGPFRNLSGEWRFIPLNANACKTVMHLEFEFSNRLIAMAFGKLFNQVAASLVEAFSKRAEQIYGNK